MSDRIGGQAEKYWQARRALIRLKGEEVCTSLHEMKAEDLTLDEERSTDNTAMEKLSRIGARNHQPLHISVGKKTMSWIWTSDGGGGGEGDDADTEKQIIAGECHKDTFWPMVMRPFSGLRVEWAKGKARKDRWCEEVMLLREEMRRVLRFLEWRATWWEAQMRTQRGLKAEIAAGLEAYALRQADFHWRVGAAFKDRWGLTAADSVRAIMEEEQALAQLFAEG